MLTPRGYWLHLLLLLLFGITLPFGQPLAILLLLAVAAWLAFEWCRFALAIEFGGRQLTVERRVGDRGGNRGSGRVLLWANQPVVVTVTVQSCGWLTLDHVALADRLPLTGQASRCPSPDIQEVDPNAGPIGARGTLRKGDRLRIQYEYRHPVAGNARFEGVAAEVTDRHGFFRRRIFLRRLLEATVLPPLAEEGRPRGTFKRINLLSTRGIHRNLRPGSSSELLELRDYQPGDPPKTIAWKVSARRDRLITKQFASDVPVRCTLMLDVSDSVRVGPPGFTPLNHSIRVAAALSRELEAAHDPVGLFLISDRDCQVLLPASGRRHLLRIHARLGEVARLPMEPSHCPPSLLLDPAQRLCREIYPDLYHPSINSAGPWWTRLLDVIGNFYVIASIYAGLGGALLAWGTATSFTDLHWALLIAYLVFGLWGWRRWRKWARKNSLPGANAWTWTGKRRVRKQVSSVVSFLQGLGAEGTSRLLNDDDYFSLQTQRFLLDHHESYSRPWFGPSGEYLFSSSKKLEVLRRALLRAVFHGRDNELFVLLFDLLELREMWPTFLASVKVALARHHQVVVLCPWPESLPPPLSKEWSDSLWPPRPTDRRPPDAAELALRELDLLRHRSAYLDLKSELGRLGVPLLAVTTSEAIPFVIRRLEQIRAARHLTASKPGGK
ncbi:MAG: DUF58 domain-containing protein [Planctomycetota bacterium]